MACPDFFIVGAPKCGTTALHGFLQAHPQIFMPVAKEIHYYGSDLCGLASQLTPGRHAAILVDAHQKQSRCIGETCIWALYSTEAAEEIHRELPDAKIVIMLRDPVEMIYALHSEFVWHRIENVRSFRRAIALEEQRKRGHRLPKNGQPAKILYYRDVARFADQVERYYCVFGRERVHVILFDDFQCDLPSVYRRLLEFLDVDPTFQPEFRIINPNKRVRSVVLREILADSGHLAHRSARILIPFPRVRQRMYSALNAWNCGYAPRPPMCEGLRQRLRVEMASEVERLSRVLQCDLGRWLGQQRVRRSA